MCVCVCVCVCVLHEVLREYTSWDSHFFHIFGVADVHNKKKNPKTSGYPCALKKLTNYKMQYENNKKILGIWIETQKESFKWIIYNQEEEKKMDGDQLSSHCLPVCTKEIIGVIIEGQCSMAVFVMI